MAFLDPWSDPLGSGYQMIQSMIAVGTGGIFGRGLMGGMQKLFYLPEPHNDFIYAVIAEELGLIGATVVLACFCVITWRGLRAAMRAPDRFGAFLAIGLTTMIAFQALLNISVVLGLLPTKGIPLPFVSAGGSSLLINMVGMAILLNVSQHASSLGARRHVDAWPWPSRMHDAACASSLPAAEPAGTCIRGSRWRESCGAGGPRRR